MRASRSFLRDLQFAAAISLALFAQNVAGAKKKKERDKRPGRNPNIDRYDEVYVIFRNSFLFALAPCAFLFLRSILTDPAVPYIIKMLWRSFKDRITSNLSSTTDFGFGNSGIGQVTAPSRGGDVYYWSEEGIPRTKTISR